MPTYEYRCRDCDHGFEIVQSFTDDSLTECPQCEGSLRKVFGNIGISFKGGGFYKTDSRAASSSGEGGSGDGGSGDGGGSSDTSGSGDSGGSSSDSSSSSSSSDAKASTSAD